jgi:hypothetical protein
MARHHTSRVCKYWLIQKVFYRYVMYFGSSSNRLNHESRTGKMPNESHGRLVFKSQTPSSSFIMTLQLVWFKEPEEPNVVQNRLLHCASHYRNGRPVNSPPWSNIRYRSRIRASQLFSNKSEMCWDDLSSIRMTSDSVVTMSIIVTAWMSSVLPWISMDQGPAKSAVTSSNGTEVSSCGGSMPWPWPAFLYC